MVVISSISSIIDNSTHIHKHTEWLINAAHVSISGRSVCTSVDILQLSPLPSSLFPLILLTESIHACDCECVSLLYCPVDKRGYHVSSVMGYSKFNHIMCPRMRIKCQELADLHQ